MQDVKKEQTNSAIDITKLIMAILVIGIHTQPFHANIWLDRGFGMITRICLPFFFVTSAYFFFKSGKTLKAYLLRIILLYVLWSIIYLPFDLAELKAMSVPLILKRYLWNGNEHALWYLQGSVIGMLIVSGLRKLLNARATCAVCFGLLAVGCIFSTYSPLIENLGGVSAVALMSAVGTRNGLFYAPAYLSLGLLFAERGFAKGKKRYWLMLLISLLLLIMESVVFVIYYKTPSTVLWISVYPASYALFQLIATMKCRLKKSVSVWMRKISILLYVTHGLFLIAFDSFGYGLVYFIAVLCCSSAVSVGIILLSDRVKLLKYFY